MLPVPVFYLKWQKNRMIRERRKNLNYQFKDALTSLSVAVQAGYSVESAVKPVSEIWRDSTERERILWRNFAILKASSISVSAGRAVSGSWRKKSDRRYRKFCLCILYSQAYRW